MDIKRVVLLLSIAACSEGKVRNNRQVPSDLDKSVVVPTSPTSISAEGGIPNGPGTVSQVDEALKVPTFTWADKASPAVLAARQNMTPENAARAYLGDYAARFRLNASVAKDTRVVNVHDLGTGPIVVQLTRDGKIKSYDGEVRSAEVFRDQAQLIMSRDHALVAISGYLTPQAAGSIDESRLQFTSTPESAIAFALTNLTGVTHGEDDFTLLGDTSSTYAEYSYNSSSVVSVQSTVRVKHIIFPTATSLEPAYYLELDTVTGPDALGFAYVVSARDGKVLFRKNLSASHSYRVYATDDGFPLDSPLGDNTPQPAADRSAAAPTKDVASRLVTLDHGPISTRDPWLKPGAGNLNGNNVYAFANVAPKVDPTNPRETTDGYQPGDIDVGPTAPDVFDRPHSSAAAANGTPDQIKAATTNLFYVVNFLHDWYNDLASTEKDGNAQRDNYGRGGAENDPIRAQAQDVSGRNNANMSTPADGRSPTMRMYLFDHSPAPKLAFSGNTVATEQVKQAAFGQQVYDRPVEKLVLVRDDAAPADDGCTPFLNGETVGGAIAVITRGTCGFAVKAWNAEQAGAVAVILLNNQPNLIVPGSDPTIRNTIPTVMIDKATGDVLRTELARGVEMYAKLSHLPLPDRDGTLDTLVVAHEWGHYISNRLNHDAAGLSTRQARGLGEGWADFHALLLTVKESDLSIPNNVGYSGAYGLTAFVAAGSFTDKDAYYSGMRRTPYSTNTDLNPLTLGHMENGVPLPPLAKGYTFGASGEGNFEVHNVGELWAQMLWECYAALLNDESQGLTFIDKQELMKRTLVASYKMTPAAPTILEARDAFLATSLATDPAYYDMFWKAFAKRGAGIRSKAPSKNSEDGVGVVESYRIGPDITVVSTRLKDASEECTADDIFDNGESATLEITLKNVGIGGVSPKVIVTSPTGGLLIADGGFLQVPALAPMETTTATIRVNAEALADIVRLDLDVIATDPSLSVPADTQRVSLMTNFDVAKDATVMDDVEAPVSAWTPSHVSGEKMAEDDWQRLAMGVEETLWFGVNPAQTGDLLLTSPAFNVSADKDFVVHFNQAFAFEKSQDSNTNQSVAYDGGVVEISTDGTTWKDVAEKLTPAYTDTLIFEDSNNPLAGRKAYSGVTENFPQLSEATINFGKDYAGKTVFLRFRSGSDQGSRNVGWLIDDIKVDGLTNKPFTKRVPNSAQNCPQ